MNIVYSFLMLLSFSLLECIFGGDPPPPPPPVCLIVPQGGVENVSRSKKPPALISIQCNLTVHKTVKFNPRLRDLINLTQQNGFVGCVSKWELSVMISGAIDFITRGREELVLQAVSS